MHLDAYVYTRIGSISFIIGLWEPAGEDTPEF